MAFPTATVYTGCAETANVTTHPVTVPAHATGDLLIFYFVCDSISESITFPVSPVFSSLAATDNSAVGDSLVYRVVDGSESWNTAGGSTFDVTTGSVEMASCAVIVIPAASWHGTTPPESTTGSFSNDANPNPPSKTASWGAEDNLFIALCGHDDGADTVTGYPTNYSDDQTNVRGNDTGSTGIGVATRQLASATDNPGTFTLSASEQWIAYTVVVRPNAGGGSQTVTMNHLAGSAVNNPTVVPGEVLVGMNLLATTSLPNHTVGESIQTVTMNHLAGTSVLNPAVVPGAVTVTMNHLAGTTLHGPTVPGFLTIDGQAMTPYILDKSITLRRSTLDLTLVDPPFIPVMGDIASIREPAWSGSVVGTKTREFGDILYVTVTATNAEEMVLEPGPFGVSDNPNGTTTFGYRDLTVDTSLHDAVTEVRGTFTMFEPGLLPGHTFELTSALNGLSAEEFTAQEVTITWFTDEDPIYVIAFGEAMVTLAAWVQGEAADGILPISTDDLLDGAVTATKITDLSVTTPKLAANAVTAGKIAAATITANELAANSVTATQIAAGAVTTSELNASAVIQNVTNSGASVVIDSSGITIEDGALVIQDLYGATVMTSTGFTGSWLSFIAFGLYNRDFALGSTSDIAVSLVGSASTIADYEDSVSANLPYWVVEASSGTVRCVTDSGTSSGRALEFSKTSSAATDVVFQDVPVVPGDHYTVTFRAKASTAGGDAVLPDMKLSWRDADHAIIGSEWDAYFESDGPGINPIPSTTDYETFRTGSAMKHSGGVTSINDEAPPDAAYLRVKLRAENANSSWVRIGDITVERGDRCVHWYEPTVGGMGSGSAQATCFWARGEAPGSIKVEIRVSVSVNGTGASTVTITLPVAPETSGALIGGWAGSGTLGPLVAFTGSGSPHISAMRDRAGATITGADLSTSASLRISGVYFSGEANQGPRNF